ncbi:hypothetical protein [Mucilaginibacter sp.]|uniref:hypothetical protein n=1 Tax=Mucilaginibacter sp. TaxID=1882438 RepID=UPI0035BC61DB
MDEFYIDVTLSQGLTRIQVDEVSPEQWDMPYAPQFIIEFHNGKEFITLTMHLEDGKWYDRNKRISEDDKQLRYFELNADNYNPYYQSPLNEDAIQLIGQAIGRHMLVHLTAYMALFIPVFPNPDLN